jgi:hypothetical protein
MFDGVGAAAIMRALVAEMNGTRWEIPPLPHPGLNVNPIEKALEPELAARKQGRKEFSDADAGFVNLSAATLIRFVAYHVRQTWWDGASRRIVILPKPALAYLVDWVRNELRREKKDASSVSTGDILVAWCLKVCSDSRQGLYIADRDQTVYSSGVAPAKIIACENIASFRSHLSSKLNDYPHNAWISLPYPLISARDLNMLSLPDFAFRLSQSRSFLSLYDVVQAHQILENDPFAFPGIADADETLLVSNVSAYESS